MLEFGAASVGETEKRLFKQIVGELKEERLKGLGWKGVKRTTSKIAGHITQNNILLSKDLVYYILVILKRERYLFFI